MDFSYLKKQDYYDTLFESNEKYLDLDDEFRENFIEILGRFYELFESIIRYHSDFLQFFRNVEDGNFLQYNFEGLIADTDGSQLMAETIYLYGVMLLVMDIRIAGHIREKLVISYYRYKGSIIENSIREVVKLCRSSGWMFGCKRPKKYPENYFARFPIPRKIINLVVGKLRGKDIYNAGRSYPDPKHRTTMLASQASMLYVLLYFAPHILQKEEATMRGIVDRHFNDNWVIPLYMGILVDLNDWWEPYKAAKSAMKNTMNKQNVFELIERHTDSIPKLKQELRHYLSEGILSEDYLMDNLYKILHCLRELNVFLRWIMLHRNTSEKKFKASICNIMDSKKILDLMIKISEFEYKIKTMLERMLATKKQKWNAFKKECFNRMVELSEYFSGEKPLTRIKKNVALQQWFKSLSTKIDSLDVDGNSNVEGRKINKIMVALADVQKYYQIGNSLQIQQFLHDTEMFLKKMIRTVNVRDDIFATINIISDFSYAWEIITDYVALMQSKIERDSTTVLMLRACFLKMVSILDMPLQRIQQCGSDDLISVSAYYSQQLVTFVRRVLDIVPKTMFDMLSVIAVQRQTLLHMLPLKFERKLLKEHAKLKPRFALAQKTHRISEFTEGILNMNTTLFGVIEVEPQQLLEDGIRKELVRRMSSALNFTLHFGNSSASLEAMLIKVGDDLGAFQQSFEHIQDYVKLYGLKVWQQEFTRIINYYVEQESNRFLRRKIHDKQSIYQSEAIPIPAFIAFKTDDAFNFTGRVVNELLAKTNYKNTVYAEFRQAWYFPSTFRISVGIRTFNLILQGLGAVGLNGLDKLVAFMIVSDLQKFIQGYHKIIHSQVINAVSTFRSKLTSVHSLPRHPQRLYGAYIHELKGIWPFFSNYILGVGQKQLIRRQMNSALHFQARIDSKMLICTLTAMNNALLHDVKSHYRLPNIKPYPSAENGVLGDLAEHLNFVGICDPIAKIYITSQPLQGLATLLFLYVISQLEGLQWLQTYSTLGRISKNDIFDGTVMAIGLVTLLKQFHPQFTQELIALLCQFIRSHIFDNQSSKNSKLKNAVPRVARNALHFLDLMCKYGAHIERKDVAVYLPSYMLNNYPQ